MFGVLFFIVIYIVINIYQIVSYSRMDETRSADVAIVLGAGTDGNKVSEVFKERLKQGIKLYANRQVKAIIVTGGYGAGNDKSDAKIAEEYLIDNGIPHDDILKEENSTITQENIENAKEIMDRKNYETALIVSDPLHMRRSMLIAKDTGVKAYSSPTKTSAYKSLKTKIPFIARETFFYIGYKWYRCLGAIFVARKSFIGGQNDKY